MSKVPLQGAGVHLGLEAGDLLEGRGHCVVTVHVLLAGVGSISDNVLRNASPANCIHCTSAFHENNQRSLLLRMWNRAVIFVRRKGRSARGTRPSQRRRTFPARGLRVHIMW